MTETTQTEHPAAALERGRSGSGSGSGPDPDTDSLRDLLHELQPLTGAIEDAGRRARYWVEAARARKWPRTLAEELLGDFPLDSPKGRALMSLAEALLRTPDAARSDQLIAERLDSLRRAARPPRAGMARVQARAASSEGAAPSPQSPALWLRLGLAVLGSAGRLLPEVADELSGRRRSGIVKPVVAPLLRAGLRRTVRRLSASFIVGDTIESALARSRSEPPLALCSFDMLGEGARTEADAGRFFAAYAHAIEVLSRATDAAAQSDTARSTRHRAGISVKLSALEPRYSLPQRERVRERLLPRAMQLARRAAEACIALTIDAEEADRLDLSLEVIEALARDPETRDWDGLGLAVQAYGRRAASVVDRIAGLARDSGRRMQVRLVKGAYWDTEIKRAQERGLADYPVFTRKAMTDLCYLDCVR
ncbi:MAG: proline dehydrogenase family protein, partial [Steroidobacteraceae bacterium]